MTTPRTADAGHEDVEARGREAVDLGIDVRAHVVRELADALADMRRQRDEAELACQEQRHRAQMAESETMFAEAQLTEGRAEVERLTTNQLGMEEELTDLRQQVERQALLLRERDEEIVLQGDTIQHLSSDLRASDAAVERLTRERDEALTEVASLHNRPAAQAYYKVAEEMKRERDRYKALAEGERDRIAIAVSNTSEIEWHPADYFHFICSLPVPSLEEPQPAKEGSL